MPNNLTDERDWYTMDNAGHSLYKVRGRIVNGSVNYRLAGSLSTTAKTFDDRNMFIDRAEAVAAVRRNLEEWRLRASADLRKAEAAIASFNHKEFSGSEW